ncbi:MAG: hypothetical protein IKT98_02915 [Selenomonadaceae bacterium]|nr:hypothetical protein [Selenomonadaceae bacterium]
MPMTEEEKSKCQKIIHGHAAAAAAGNLVPIPALGLAADTVTMTTMAMALAAVLGGSITESVAKNMAINAVVATMKKQPVRLIAKEISKVVPVVGQLVAPTISVAMLESAGWLLVEQLVTEREKFENIENVGTVSGGHNFRYEKKFQLPNPD